MVSRVCEFVCQSELSYFVPGVRVRQLSKLSFRVVVIPFSFFARAKVVKVINSFLKLFSGLKSFVYPPRCKYCNSVVFHPLLYAIDISFLQNLRYFRCFSDSYLKQISPLDVSYLMKVVINVFPVFLSTI